MIKTFEIRNFKCFARLRLSMGSLTLLTGFNGSGKSSAIQPLLLLAQWGSPIHSQRVSLNGSLVSLGTPGDILPPDAETSHIVFAFGDEKSELSWTLTASSGDRLLTVADLQEITFAEGKKRKSDGMVRMFETLAQVIYISAVREGTSDYYLVPASGRNCRGDVGVDGRFASFWYDQLVDDEVPSGRRHTSEPATL